MSVKQKNTGSNRPGKSFWQKLLAFFLIGFPILMIAVNGRLALTGILWTKASGLSRTMENSLPEVIDPPKVHTITNFGVFDPEGRFDGDTCFRIQQIYLNWFDFSQSSLENTLKNIVSKGRIPYIVVEPWNNPQGDSTLLDDIIASRYDGSIKKIIESLSVIKGEFYLSWGHEMDQDITKRYPWSESDPELYKAAYHYVVDKIRKKSGPAMKLIWSPVGKKGCENYWPGTDYADYVGFPIYSYPKWDKSYYGNIRSFRTWFNEKYELVRQFDKPVFIVELGVTGDPDYQVYWLQEAFNELKNDLSVEGIVFFYKMDTPGSWGKGLETPDWRTNPDIIRGFVTWISGKS